MITENSYKNNYEQWFTSQKIIFFARIFDHYYEQPLSIAGLNESQFVNQNFRLLSYSNQLI